MSEQDCGPEDEQDLDDEYVTRCPVDGEPIDYCLGHGEVGDPVGHAALEAHDDGDHYYCHPDGCDDAETEEILL